MKLTVKTLKGGKFVVEAEDSQTVAQVKGIIEATNSELPAANMKLIHSGKVLKDEDAISACGIKEADFVVAMVTKPKKPAAAPKATVDTVASPAADDATPKTETPAAATPATAAAAASVTTPAAPKVADKFPDDVVANLTGMGFPEAEVRHCLRAAHGNPDVAVEFLTNGIPDGVAQAADFVNATTATPAATTTSGSAPLQALRNHPQFDALRRLVQSNPGALQQVLTQIGQQQPELLAEINANQTVFLEMMNEPITAGSSAQSARSGEGAAAAAGMMEGMGGGMGNPAQMAQMIQGMSEAELGQMSAMMGLSPEQLRATAQMIGSMPADQLNQFMAQALGGSPFGGGPQVLRLTEEEMAAVDRLAEMGFDRSEAAQAFLACDKNEALAANLLMDSIGNGGFFDDNDSGNDDDNNNNDRDNNNDGDDENMYD